MNDEVLGLAHLCQIESALPRHSTLPTQPMIAAIRHARDSASFLFELCMLWLATLTYLWKIPLSNHRPIMGDQLVWTGPFTKFLSFPGPISAPDVRQAILGEGGLQGACASGR